jgi:hypothetical protein
MGYNQHTGRKPIMWEVDENGCWNCTSHSRNQKGYPILVQDNKYSHMSRFIWKECFGEIPNEMQVLHKCDNPSCINPEHFFLGTNADNVKDKMTKGRHKNNTPKGEKHWWAKLSRQQAIEIYNATGSQHKIAKEYGITQSTVSAIKKGTIWKGLMAG